MSGRFSSKVDGESLASQARFVVATPCVETINGGITGGMTGSYLLGGRKYSGDTLVDLTVIGLTVGFYTLHTLILSS